MTELQRTDNSKGARRPPAMLERYRKRVIPELAKEFRNKNVMAAARIEKIVLNIGCGEAAHDAKLLESAMRDLSLIAGQRACITRAKKAVSNFRVRKNDPVGCRVTLRRNRMYEFLQRLINVALPRIRDFRGLDANGIDQGGNFNFGIREHMIFPEVESDKSIHAFGLDVAIVIRSRSRAESYSLLKQLGFPLASQLEDVV